MKTIDLEFIESLAIGASLLGAGGGGDPYIGKLLASWAIETYGEPRLFDLSEVPDDAVCVMSASMGAPTVAVERLPGGDELHIAIISLQRYIGKRITHLVGLEIGGMNSMLPIASAARTQLPLVDCDAMGRAFPELQMCTPSLFDKSATPMVLADECGNTVIIDSNSNLKTEKMARQITVEMGAVSYIALYPLSGKELKETMIPGTISLARDIGDKISKSRADRVDVLNSLLKITNGVLLFEGKITDVDRKTHDGFARGTVELAGIGDYTDSKLRVIFQNENLIASLNSQVIATVPDLICLVEPSTCRTITTEELRYGLRTIVIGIPCDSRWRTERGLQLVGPKYFGYDIKFTPVEK
jgi:DUF917 family protein